MTDTKETSNPQKDLQEEIKILPTAEEKLKAILDFMEEKLTKGASPQFKLFWDARESCVELFKQVDNPVMRSQLWGRYSELSKEARRIKELLDEESAFNVEQIELAINAIENEIVDMEAGNHVYSDIEFPLIKSFQKHLKYYASIQKELNLLNAYASRIHAMRKELIKTEMRIKIKNKFFDRLSSLGDRLFPRRKALIDEISQKFETDVSLFIEYFFPEEVQESPFFLRDEIKGLQEISKILTLSSHAFKETRLKLSECWDRLKGVEKEFKKQRAELKEQFKQNHQAISEKIQEIDLSFEEKTATPNQIEDGLYELSKEMRGVELGRDEVKSLKDAMQQIRDKIDALKKVEEDERLKAEQIRDQERKEKVLNFKNRILALLNGTETMDLADILKEREALIEEVAQSSLNRHEKLEIEKEFKPLKEIIADKQEQKLLSMPEDDRQALTSLKQVLQQRNSRKQEVKQKLDELRKQSNASSLDLKKAMLINEQIVEEREKLEKLNEGIKEIEERIKAIRKE